MKQFLNVKMINLIKKKKKKRKSARPSSFKKTCPCTVLPPTFKNFSDSPPPLWKRYLKFTFAPLNRMGGRGGLNYHHMLVVQIHQGQLIVIFFEEKVIKSCYIQLLAHTSTLISLLNFLKI